jgi:hypothetical protein
MALLGAFGLVVGTAGPQDLSKIEIQTIPVAGNISMLVGGGGNIGVSGREDGVLLIDDHAILRQGLAQLINQESDLVVCGEAEEAPKGSPSRAEMPQPHWSRLPIWGVEAEARGHQIPLPFGIGINYYDIINYSGFLHFKGGFNYLPDSLFLI